jgi:hypothetical protein
MEFMGHADLQMVQRYVKLLPQPEQSNPAERLNAYLRAGGSAPDEVARVLTHPALELGRRRCAGRPPVHACRRAARRSRVRADRASDMGPPVPCGRHSAVARQAGGPASKLMSAETIVPMVGSCVGIW